MHLKGDVHCELSQVGSVEGTKSLRVVDGEGGLGAGGEGAAAHLHPLLNN